MGDDSGTVRIAVLNVKYSPNLGDGVIAECLEHEIARLRPDWQIRSIDLAGREDFSTGLDAGRSWVLMALDTMPRPLRHAAVTVLLSILVRWRLRKIWRRQLANVDAVIIGGGQLFADADLNFPLKLCGAQREVLRAPRPVAVFGVGVANHLTRRAKSLFQRTLRGIDLAHVAVRDGLSVRNWDHHFAPLGIMRAGQCHDPGLLADGVYPKCAFAEPRERPLIGLGIVNPRTLDRHSSSDNPVRIERALNQSAQLAIKLLDWGFDVSLFTNGAHDDEEFLDQVLGRAADPRIRRSRRPHVPRELAGIIRSFDAVIAHRLHASILAYAFRIPHVGLTWNAKVQAFFNSVGRGHFVTDLEEADPSVICELIERAHFDGIDGSAHAAVVQETRDAVRLCIADLSARLGTHVSEATLHVQNSVGA